ncbi:YjiH family protein [Brevibacterium album]|uniref:YjiH family protein n=1 Tax=Brevibacterium album TaxID=417948 RepID=UPI001FDF2894|nr:YjiH family protein [Brevibacterium album]
MPSGPAAALRFLLPSLLGLLIFVAPVPDGAGGATIPVAFLASMLETALAAIVHPFVVAVMGVSALGSLLALTVKPGWMQRGVPQLLFDVTAVWCLVRCAGFALGLATLLELGPEGLWGEDTGGLILDLCVLMFTVFLFAGFLLPLLLDFGLLEFAGVLMNRVMRPVFTVPGRSSVDALASWFGDATIGVLMTNQQYEKGFYTKRESAILGTTFNVVSLTFTVVIIGLLGLQHMTLQFYATIVVAGLVAAVIMPRIPPLSRIPDEYIDGSRPERAKASGAAAANTGSATTGAAVTAAAGAEQGSPLRRAWDGALRRASQVWPGLILRRGASNVLEMWVGIIPVIMAVGTVAVLIAEHTPLFAWLGTPFVPLLELMGVPEARAASETVLVGFADMLLPTVIGAGIETEMTRFVIGCLSITQLIFMSEVGGLLLASKIPVKFHHLVLIFLLRTLITLPIVVLAAHLFY